MPSQARNITKYEQELALLDEIDFRNEADLDRDWMVQAACRGLSEAEADAMFFPTNRNYPKKLQMKRLCGGCPVKQECLRYGYTIGCHGVWGGMTEEERRVAIQELQTDTVAP